MPVAKISKDQPADDGIEPGEEFTPEEQLELVRENAKAGKMDIIPPRRKKRPESQNMFKRAGTAMSIAMLAGLGAVLRQEKFEVGYCGIGRPSTEIAGIEVPAWAKTIQPKCEPCPPHAWCGDHLKTRCDKDFILKPHPLSLGGFLPFPPTCDPDSEKVRKVQAVADRAVEELRGRNAKVECGEMADETGKPLATPEILEVELKESVSSKRRKGMSQQEFDDLWTDAIGEVEGRDEVVVGSDGYVHTRAQNGPIYTSSI